MFDYNDSERRVRGLLAAGFLLVILLVVTDAVVSFVSIRSIQRLSTELAEDQFTQMALVDEVQREQGALSSIFYSLSADADTIDRSRIVAQVEATEQNVQSIVAKVPANTSEMEIWQSLLASSSGFAAEAKRLLQLKVWPTRHSRELLARHDDIVNTVSKLSRLTHLKSQKAKDRIQALASSQLRKDGFLLGGCVLLACVCAVLVMRTSTKLYQRLAAQSEQLTQISWQLLDKQEMVARRLSHELHDELGQSLTALKTAFTRHVTSGCGDADWGRSCSNLLKDSIHSVHEISQLLRPTILDDFGLASALSWLCERFEEGGGPAVQCVSSFDGRLKPETETHLFRIAQEATTNAVRHSGATLVKVTLNGDRENVYLSIEDNGRGLPPRESIRKGAFGITGMRARAQSSKGSLSISSQPGKGTRVHVSVPLAVETNEEKNSHLASG